jgi:predicted permease
MRWGRKKREDDLDRELRAHLELEAEEQRENRLMPEAARYAARRALGNTALIQEATRETWGLLWMDRLAQDLRYGIRGLQRNPGFAALAVLTAALGVGANTSIFSVVDAVLLRPLPYPHADRLVSPTNIGKDNFMGLGVGDFQYAAWRGEGKIFDGIAAYRGGRSTLTGSGDPEQVESESVSPGFLGTLGMAPLMGRDFADSDATPRGGLAVIVSYRLWQKRFGADPAILSKAVTLNGKSFAIIGVLPWNFEFPENKDADVLVAMTEPASRGSNGAIYFYSVIARLKPGVTVERAQSDVELINQRLQSAFPQKFGRSRNGGQTRILGLHDRLVGNVRPALLVLAGAVGLVLLIVCVNISNLLLARALARQKEIAVRIALGAGRGRVMRQLLTEGMLLAAAGGGAGLALAFGGVRLLRAIAPAGVPHVENAHIGGAVLAFNVAIAALSGILFGLAPLRAASRIDPEAALKQSARTASGGRKHRTLENLLVVSEMAFALILLAGAGLLMRTFAGLTAIAPGFHPDRVVTAQVSLPYWKYRTPERQREFLSALLEKARAAPGADAVGAVACLPYGGFVMSGTLQIDGKPALGAAATDADSAAVNYAAGDYFKAMGIPILEGRAIDSGDQVGRPGVAVINQTLARHFFADRSPLGAHIRINGVTDWLEVVGVAGDLKQGGRSLASETRAELFQSDPQVQDGGNAHTLSLRSNADPRILMPWLRAKIAELDKDLPPAEIETMRTKMASLVASQLFVMRLLALFAGIAVILAAIGIYSVLVYSVEQRTHEIGIRLALGAKRWQIMGLILARGLRLSIAGAAIGTAGGLALTRYLKSLLYGVTPHDPFTLGAGCALVLAVALGAAYLPARRAVEQDPIATLRTE